MANNNNNNAPAPKVPMVPLPYVVRKFSDLAEHFGTEDPNAMKAAANINLSAAKFELDQAKAEAKGAKMAKIIADTVAAALAVALATNTTSDSE